MLMSYIGYPGRARSNPSPAAPATCAAHAAVGRGLRHERREPDVRRRRDPHVEQHGDPARPAGGRRGSASDDDDGTTPFMAAPGLGRSTYTPRQPRGVRSPSAEEAVRVLLEAGADIDAVNEADFTALHGAAFRGLNEVVEYLVAQGADIDARDFRGRTAYRMAEGSKQSFQFQELAGNRRPARGAGRRHADRHPRNRPGTPARRAGRRRERSALTGSPCGRSPECVSSSRRQRRSGPCDSLPESALPRDDRAAPSE